MEAFHSRPVGDAAELDVPGKNGGDFYTIRRGLGVVEVNTVDVGGARGAVGKGAKGSAKGVEEGFAGRVGDHVGGCEETRGGADDALCAYSDEILERKWWTKECLRSFPGGGSSFSRTSLKP